MSSGVLIKDRSGSRATILHFCDEMRAKFGSAAITGPILRQEWWIDYRTRRDESELRRASERAEREAVRICSLHPHSTTVLSRYYGARRRGDWATPKRRQEDLCER